MSDTPGSPSTTSLKRKRPASEQPSFVESALSPDSKQSLMEESSLPSFTADIAMTNLPTNTAAAALDLDGFTLQSLRLLETSTMSGFLELLSSALAQVVAPGSLVAPDLFVSALSDILPYNPSLPTQVLDVINQCWIDQSSDARDLPSAVLQSLINANIVPTDLAIELVDRNILQDSSIISNSQILATRSVRINTGLLYKQQKFNLLREENEGYAKLSHEFNVALSEFPKGGLTDAADISAKSNDLLTVVNALIGYFELDPNRVLDNILDICSQNLLSHARFILHFLHRSPWAPKTLAVTEPFNSVNQSEKRRRLDFIQKDFSGYFTTEMAREGGSDLAAQLLGFKFRHFASALHRHERSYTAPESLVFLTALLIKSGFIKLGDIYPYLNPLDNAINDEYRKWKEEMDEKAFMAKSNPLALAGALGDDEGGHGQDSQTMETESKHVAEAQKAAETNQKVALLNALLAVGSLPAALQLLSLHPQISGPHMSVSDGIHRLLHFSIAKVYAPFSPSRSFEPRIMDGLEAQRKRAAASRTNHGTVDWLEDLERKSVRGYSPFPNQEYGDRKIRFFLEDEFWADDIPICETMEDFYAFAVNMLRFTGPRVGNDVSLLVKLARIGKGQFSNGEQSQSLMRRWVEIARISLVPAISLIGANPGVVNEIYNLIRFFNFETRFSLYGEWQTMAYKIYPELKLKASETDKDTKGILRRISKQDVKRFGRALAKKSTSNPLILWAIAINQIENYDNFVEVVVDAAKFCTNLGYDVLEFVILTSLANPFKNRVKEDGTSIALWLTGLSAFCAKVFRRYAHMDVSTATTYVACQLKSGNIYDLIVLRDLITQMAGILVPENLSDHQLRCYSGGEALKEQGMSLLRESGTLAGWKKSGARLLKALLDTNLAGLLLMLIAQERGVCLFNSKMEHNSNLKLLGNLFDECHGVLIQFHEFIVSNLDSVSFERLLPPFEKIVTDYGVDPPTAFYLWRPILAEKIRQHDVDLSLELQKQKILKGLANTEKSTDSRNDPGSQSLTADSEIQHAPEGTSSIILAVSSGLEEAADVDFTPVKSDEPWHPALRAFINEARLVLGKDVWNYMSPQFYTTFWQLSLYDILVPMQAYKQESQKLTTELLKKDADKTDMSPLAIQRRRRERERLQAIVDQLTQEFKIQTTSYQTTRARLSKEKEFWFDWAKLPSGPESSPPRNKTVLAILQHCVIPRCLFGPNDAIFCARFLREMHRLGTNNFSSLTLMDKIFVSVSETVIFTCTNREAENYGRFLREILIELSRWYSDKSTYEKEAIGPAIPGFLKKWSVNPAEAIHLQYEEYRTVMSKWHKNLTTAFKNCLESRDYMHVRNALAVLEKIIGQYPQVDFHGTSLEEKVSAIAAKGEMRGDLQVRAQGYLALLRKSSKSWISSAKFGSQSKGSSTSAANSPNPNRPTTPQATLSPARTTSSTASDRETLRTKSTLNPAAASFKPHDDEHRKAENSTNGSANPSKSTSGDSGLSSADRATSRRSGSPRNLNQPHSKTDPLSSKETIDRLSRTFKSQEYDQGKLDNGRHERVSRQREESTVSANRSSNNGQAPFSDAKSEPALRSRDEVQSNVGGSDQHRTARVPSTTSAQGEDIVGRRPRTPEGPRATVDIARSDSPGQRNAAQRDPQALRPPRYDTSRTANVNSQRSIQGFRAPPPTGPRSAAVSGGSSTLANVNITRQQQPGRSVGAESQRAVSNLGPRPSGPPTGKSEASPSSTTTPTTLSDRNLPRSIPHRDSQGDPTNLAITSESRRLHPTQSDSNSKSDHVQASDSSRPTDWRGRQTRDIQDEDPRRLSRGPDNLADEPGSTARPLRQADDTIRSALLKQAENTKEPVTSTSRVPRDKDEKDHNQSSRQTRESRPENEKAEVGDGRRTRTTARTETSEASGRSRGNPSATGQSERAKVSSSHDSKSTESGNTLERRKSLPRDQKETIPAERREIQKEKAESTSREPKDSAPKEQRSTRSHRDDDSGRRREERDSSTRTQREDTRDSRNDRARASHHTRVSSRRSPSRTHSDRGDKKERDRDGERRNGNQRDTRETEHRDKERSSRESEHRRDARDRDRSSREKEQESRRGSRKHERDRSSDAVDRGTRSGEGVDSSGQVESANKRRRVAR